MHSIPTHQMMGYDRAITMFSPDGRLLQVEYAKKTVGQGSTAIGMQCKDGVLLVADKRVGEVLIVPESVEKIFKIDDHIATAASGILSDARVLVERAQVKSQQHKVTYDTPIDTLTVVKDICALKQICTQSGGLRPFGVALLVIGVDTQGARLYETDPTGIYFQFKATAIGEGESKVKEILEKDYRETISIEDGAKLSIKALKKVSNTELSTDKIEVAYITNADKKFETFSKEKIEKLLK